MYKYVSKKQVKPYKTYCQTVLEKLRRMLHKKYGIETSSVLIGSGAQNLVTQDGKGVFDLDYNLVFTALPERYESNLHMLKDTVRMELDHLLDSTSSHGQDSTAAITYPVHSIDGRPVRFSFDVALIKKDKYLYRLIHDKKQEAFIWNQIFDSELIAEKAAAIHKAGKWNELRAVYLQRKNMYLHRQDHDHPSHVVYIEAVNLIYQQIQ